MRSIEVEHARKKAIEFWNTLEGRYKDITPTMFNEVNDLIDRSYFLKNGIYLKPTEIVGSVILDRNGAYVTPWPKVHRFIQKNLSLHAKDIHCTIEEIYAL